jgi:methionyl-tRNA formyltransferase
VAALRARGPDFALSAHFCEILPAEIFRLPRHGVANLHSAFLPYNRGHWPEVWSIVRGTPAGMTLHYISEGIDTGDIIDQVRVAIAAEDTCDSLARKIEIAGIELVLRNWEALVHGRATRSPQRERFPINLHAHLDRISEIHLDRMYTGRELLDVLRALTIPRLLEGAFFIDPQTGDRIRVQVSLTREPSCPQITSTAHLEATSI